ncbi:MAG: YncE family protein [Alphaproteobacteria bacterium]
MTDSEKRPWYKRWFGGVGWKEYLHALPFSVTVLFVPLLPAIGIYYVLQQGRAPIISLLLLFLTFGYPLLRVKRPRAAWWIGTIAAMAGLFGLAVLNVIMGTFFGFFTFLTWALAAAFLVLNWKQMRWWTYAIVGALLLVHIVPMGLLRTILALIGMGLVALYLRLPDRDNFPLAPIVVTIMTLLLLAHGVQFYFDVGGLAEVKDHPAARKVFEYKGQKGGWARTLGGNTRFLTPSCEGDKFYVGTKFTLRSGLTVIDPATGKHQTVMRGGTTDNMAMTCDPERVYVGIMGGFQILIIDPENPKPPLAREGMQGVRVGMLRLDPRAGRLYVASSNTKMLHVLKSESLADQGGAELGSSVTDFAIDFWRGHEVVAVTMGGELVRISPWGQILKRQKVGSGMLVYNLALDGKNRRLFVTSMFSRVLKVFDADSLNELGSIRVRKGARYMQFDHRREMLYVANFFKGTITAFDGNVLARKWHMRVGRRVRYLTLDGRRDQLCFTSQVGGYCLYLEKLSPAPPDTPTPQPAVTPTPEPAEDAESEPAAEAESAVESPPEADAPEIPAA